MIRGRGLCGRTVEVPPRTEGRHVKDEGSLVDGWQRDKAEGMCVAHITQTLVRNHEQRKWIASGQGIQGRGFRARATDLFYSFSFLE